MDKFASMSAFIKVVETGSFAEAARQLGQSRSQINRLVINLEDSLSATLLNRTTRQVTLSSTGQAYFERAKTILDDLTETEHFIQSNEEAPSGELKINAPMSFGTLHMGAAIIDFMKRYPQIRIQLVLTDEIINPVSNGFDMTVRIDEPKDTPSLIDHTIIQAKCVLCASPDFIEKYGHPNTLEDIKELPCLHYGNLPTGNNWKLTGPKGEESIRVKGLLCSNNAEILKDAAIEGMGIALLPTFIAGEALQAATLQTILPNYSPPKIYLCLLYPPNRHLSARISLFVRFMQERFGDKPSWDSFAR